jgi:hypothetical protein
VPLHIDAAYAVPVEQLAAWQTVVASYSRQAPAPSHVPSVPQVDAACAEQSLRRSVPASALMQVPRLLVDEQVWQVPLQAVWQQTPSTQNPLAQSPPTAQAVPSFSCGTQ